MKFDDFPKVDAHVHYNTYSPTFLMVAKENNFRLVSINTDIYFFPSVKEQENIISHHKESFGNRLDYISSFAAAGFNDSTWNERTIEAILASETKGAVGIKIWKNIGMELCDKSGRLVLINDSRLAFLFEFLENQGIRITGHQGEPKNCWLPLDEMTVESDREYFSKHPEYHMHLLPEFPTYQQQIEARDSILRKYPNLLFCGAHFASVEWSVDEIAKRLDAFPNLMVDTAERICHLQYQSIFNYDKVRDFVIKYQDRIMYGTDLIDDDKMSRSKFANHVKEIWMNDWNYFTTKERQSNSKVRGAYLGLDLPLEVVQKIYYKNAVKFYRLKKI
jgi:predicted TIM-barrel fold metal-dependent hydrolase